MDEQLSVNFEYSMSQVKTCPIIKTSALKNKHVKKILEKCISVYENWNTKISTSKLNEWLAYATEENIPPICAGKRVKLKFINQVGTRPPRFNIYTSSKLKDFPDSYIRYLTNSLREEFKIIATPIRIHIKKTRNPYQE